jgi:hypothetical protein
MSYKNFAPIVQESKAPWISNLSPATNQPSNEVGIAEPTFTVAANSGTAHSAIVRLGKGFALTVKQEAGN